MKRLALMVLMLCLSVCIGHAAAIPGAIAGSYFATKPNRFYDGTNVGNLPSSFTEFSGLARGIKPANRGYLWGINDGATAYIIALNRTNGANAGQWTITMTSSDVEDCASANVGGQPYVYLCDSGDNANARATFKVVRVKEPTITGSNSSIPVGDTEEITVQFPASNIPSHKDVECLLVDPFNGHMYFVTKRITPVLLYRLQHASSYVGTQTLEYLGQLTSDSAFNTISTTTSGNNGYVTGGDISPNGTEILLKSYREVWRFPRNISSQSVLQALQATPAEMVGYVGGGDRFLHPYLEPQGEAVAFDSSGLDVYTCSELVANRGSGASAYPLFKYSRASAGTVTTYTFREGLNGYAGTTDTYVDQAAPTTDNGAGTSMVCDFDYSAYPTISRVRAGLLRWDISTIPTNVIVLGAKIDVYINTEGLGMTWFRMLTTWNEASTYNSLTAGVSTDGVEASATSFQTIIDAVGEGIDTYTGAYRVNIPISIVQDWVSNSSTNFGVYITGPDESTGDGLQLDTSEGLTDTRRPTLTIRTITRQ